MQTSYTTDRRQARLTIGKTWGLHLVWTDKGLAELSFIDEGTERDGLREGIPVAPVPQKIADVLTAYFAGEPVDPTTIEVDVEGTPFQKRVWEALRSIPRGQLRTYASIAAQVGSPRGMRAVGMANARNPIAIVVPCHRVIQAGSKLGGYSAGLDRKRRLLELEGVRMQGETLLPGQLDLLS